MDMSFMLNIKDKDNYLLVLRAVNGEELTDDEVDKLFNIYKDILINNITDDDLIRIIMYADIDSLNGRLSDKDKYMINLIKKLFKENIYNINIDIDSILNDESANKFVKIAVVKSILDALSTSNDIPEFKNDVNKLIEFISKIDKNEYNAVSMFIGFIRTKFNLINF